MSFALTTAQIRHQTKTVTRRIGWAFARPGMIVQPVVKGQGIPKGGHVETIGGPIRFVAVRFGQLGQMLPETIGYIPSIDGLEPAREGFPDMTPADFVAMFCAHHRCTSATVVTRIQFEYVEVSR